MVLNSPTKENRRQLHVKRRVENVARLAESILEKDWDKLEPEDVQDLTAVKVRLAQLLSRYKYVGYGV